MLRIQIYSYVPRILRTFLNDANELIDLDAWLSGKKFSFHITKTQGMPHGHGHRLEISTKHFTVLVKVNV